jgi:uncharacterized protein (TIGR00730 family)
MSEQGGGSAVCVFCGAKPGAKPAYLEAARAFGGLLAAEGRPVVFGGGGTGLMGALADGAIAAGGRTIGVIPKSLVDLELAHTGLDELHVVETMHERKTLMHELSGALVALPGGVGTFEEILEALTWSVLKYHAKPVGLLNVEGYWDAFLSSLDHAVGEGFFRREQRELLLVEEDAAALYARIRDWQDPDLPILEAPASSDVEGLDLADAVDFPLPSDA